MFGEWFKSKHSDGPAATLPPGQRVYAIGDIHGRLDLLDALLAMVDADNRARAPTRVTFIFLGDLIDRGPDSAAVVDRLIELKRTASDTRFLLGNHEEVMLLALEGDREAMKLFERIGGRETMLSYGLPPAMLDQADFDDLAELLRRCVPREHVEFLSAFEDYIVLGDYAFVHAGVRPGTPVDAQKPSDLRWIRREFLRHRGTLDKVVVHGHTIAEEVECRPHRIGIDTGAYYTGRLTALGLEGDQHWMIQTQGPAMNA